MKMQELAINGGGPIRENFLKFGVPDIQENEINEVVKVLKSGWIGKGPITQDLENKFAEYIGVKHAISLNSATAGLFLALDILGINSNDEVITTPLTFAATANVIEHSGSKPIFVDVIEGTGLIDVENVEDAITKKTKAIMPVHLYGQACDMNKLRKLAKKHNLYVIEDAAHAIESVYESHKIGSIGDISIFSFYATKNMTTGEGGMFVTNNDEWAEQARIKHLHGLNRDAWNRYTKEEVKYYDVIYPGYKFNMSDIQAAIGIHQLNRLDKNLIKREIIWNIYQSELGGIEELTLLEEEKYSPNLINIHSRHLFTAILNFDKLLVTRRQFLEALKRENIGFGIHFLALHLTTYYQKKYGYKRGEFPIAEKISDGTFSLPIYPTMTKDDAFDVVKAIKKIIYCYKK
jgi:dTDP-4-amino-4,6-dideoxygalactose transaminase